MTRSLTRSFVVLVFCLSPIPALVAQADTAERDWRRVSYESVLGRKLAMVTDLGPDRAKTLLRELELFDALVDEFVAPFIPLARQIAPELVAQEMQAAEESRRAGDGATLRLVVMRRRADFTRLFRTGHFAALTIPTLDRTTLVVGPAGRRDSVRDNLLHEYVHYRMRRDVPGGLPLWFEEGLASFLSHVKFTELDRVGDGSHLFKLGLWRDQEGPPDMPLDEVLAIRDLEEVSRRRTQNFYRTSHALVRYLYLQSSLDKQQLASSLVLGKPEFSQQFGLDLKAASKALRKLQSSENSSEIRRQLGAFHPGRDDFLRGHIRVVEQSSTSSVASMEVNDVREILADSALLVSAEAAGKLYERVLKNEPNRISATLGYARALRLQSKTDDAAVVLASAQVRDSEAWGLMLERSLLDTSGCIVRRKPQCLERWRDAVFNLRDVLDRQPDSFEAIYRLGLAHLYLGQPGESLGYLEIAWRRAPWSARVNYFLGENLRLVGDSRARWYLRNAARWAASDYFREASRMALAELDEAAPKTANPGEG